MDSRVLAVEGPAGVGKSRWVKDRKAEWPDFFLIKRPVFPREMNAGMGAWSSSYLDYSAIAAAVMMGRTVLADRFLLSRWVYRGLQANGELPERWRGEMEHSFATMRTMAMAEATNRISPGVWGSPLVIVTVLVPELSTLLERRALGAREYPFDAASEIRLYGEMYAGLVKDPIPGLIVVLEKV